MKRPPPNAQKSRTRAYARRELRYIKLDLALMQRIRKDAQRLNECDSNTGMAASLTDAIAVLAERAHELHSKWRDRIAATARTGRFR